jgi:hypothetical protein
LEKEGDGDTAWRYSHSLSMREGGSGLADAAGFAVRHAQFSSRLTLTLRT